MKRIAAVLIALPLSAATLLAAPQSAQAQSWPARPVKLVVPFGAGGPADIYARFLGQRLQEPLGQSFVVAWNTIKANQDGTDFVAERLIDAGELYGDDVVRLLDQARLRKPTIDVMDETTWPVI